MTKRLPTIDWSALRWTLGLSLLITLLVVASVADLFLARPAFLLLGIPLGVALGLYLYSCRNWGEEPGPDGDETNSRR
jgi:hypothetical protein